MRDSVPILVMLFLLSSYMSMATPNFSSIPEESDYLGDGRGERVEIAPDPNSIKDLGSPEITFVGEGERAQGALSSIGEFTDIGFEAQRPKKTNLVSNKLSNLIGVNLESIEYVMKVVS